MQKSVATCMRLIILIAILGITGCSSSASQTFDFDRLFTGVFVPRPGEKDLVMIDTPHGSLRNNSAWEMRRRMDVILDLHPIYA